MSIRTMGIGAAAWLLAIGMAAAAPVPDSRRMERAKDFIADEQWLRAIVELQAAADDPKEVNRDEALFWLAHSQAQAGDDSAALQTIVRLERTSPKSRWRGPANSLRVEIAQRLGLAERLWQIAGPAPAPPAPPVPPGATPLALPPRPVALPVPPMPAPAVAPVAVPPPAQPAPTPAAARMHPPKVVPPAPLAPPAMPTPFWPTAPDRANKVLALTVLLDTHADLVIPLLSEIAVDRSNPEEARQAVFLLGQTRGPAAQRTLLEVAYDGPEPVRIAAVRELGRFEGPMISSELMRVYTMSNTPMLLKRQVVSSFGDRADSVALLNIVRREPEPDVRDFAIFTLGRTGARNELRTLYVKAPQKSQPAVLSALFTARDDDELIRIAKTESNPALRARARQMLRMLATPKALKYLEDNP